MTDPQAIPFDQAPWEEEAPGVRARVMKVEGARWAMVEYAEGAGRPEWCPDGHRGIVLRGRIRYEFDDGRDPIEAAEGQALVLPAGISHRGANLGTGSTLLFLIDDAEPSA